MTPGSTIGVAGAGAWGIALANVAASAGRRVVLWGRDADALRALARSRQSARLPGATLAAGVEVSADVAALDRCEAALIVVPAQETRRAAEEVARALPRGAPLVACAKGIERGSDLFMTQVLAEAAPGHPVAIFPDRVLRPMSRPACQPRDSGLRRRGGRQIAGADAEEPEFPALPFD